MPDKVRSPLERQELVNVLYTTYWEVNEDTVEYHSAQVVARLSQYQAVLGWWPGHSLEVSIEFSLDYGFEDFFDALTLPVLSSAPSSTPDSAIP